MLKLVYAYADPDRGPDMPCIAVGPYEGDGVGVELVLEAHPKETFDDRDVTRTLLPDEARALAAALWHYADESER